MVWLASFGVVSVVSVVFSCLWYLFSLRKNNNKQAKTDINDERIKKIRCLRQNSALFRPLLCINTGTSMENVTIYDEYFAFNRIGL